MLTPAPIRPRQPDLGLNETIPRHWLAGSAVATHLVNGVNLLFPQGERFFVRSVNRFADRIADPVLREQIRGFCGQEGKHARSHEEFFDVLTAQGYQVQRFLGRFGRMVRFLERLGGKALCLATTAAAEHFTAILAEAALRDGIFAEAHPAPRALLLWHSAEEIEHKAVAFDVLLKVRPGYGLRMAGLLMATLMLGGWWLVGTTMLLRQDGVPLRRALRDLRALRTRRPNRVLRRVFAGGIRQYMRRDFHPADNDNAGLAASYLASVGLP